MKSIWIYRLSSMTRVACNENFDGHFPAWSLQEWMEEGLGIFEFRAFLSLVDQQLNCYQKKHTIKSNKRSQFWTWMLKNYLFAFWKGMIWWIIFFSIRMFSNSFKPVGTALDFWWITECTMYILQVLNINEIIESQDTVCNINDQIPANTWNHMDSTAFPQLKFSLQELGA